MRKVCIRCGLPEDQHHDYEPSMPDGCVCAPGEWGDDVQEVCDKYVATSGGAYCARCEHDEVCHKKPSATLSGAEPQAERLAPSEG